MKRVLVFAAMLLSLVAAPIGALAANDIQDNGNMFSSGAKNQATQIIDGLQRQTGKEVVVYTVPSLNGQDPSTAADSIFRSQNVNGVLLFMSNQDRRLEIKVGQDTRQALTTQRETQIRDTILSDFRSNKFDQGLLDGVNGVRSALLSAPGGANGRGGPVRQSGPPWVLIGLLIVGALIVVWVISGVRRARQQPYFSYGQNPPPGSAYGQPGYGPGWGGGGGGFFSGMLGGLGGALLGNALFDAFRPRDRFSDGGPGYDQGLQNQGWQGDDAGQVSDTPADSGGWGDSGSGDWGGGGDAGGGDSGGSW